MFNSNMDSLLNNFVSDLFVDEDTKSSGGNIPDLSSLSVVISVWHTLVNRAISNNINVISSLEGGQISANIWCSMLSKGFGEHVSSSSTITVGMRHFDSRKITGKNFDGASQKPFFLC